MSFLSSAESIAYLGPGGSYTEMAKDKFSEKYGLTICQVPMTTIKQVLAYVDETPNSLGIVPIENSIEGEVRETVDNLVRTKDSIKILSEFVMPIKHCLLSKTTELYSISGIISHPQALAQCQNFIHNEMPRNIDIIEAPSTAEAARRLQEYNLTYAAIGSAKTAENYYLNILKEEINDDHDNKTRFALIGDFETPRSPFDTTALAFSTENKPGALLEVLQIFHDYAINLSYISSRPSKTKFGEYMFFVDFDGHIEDAKVLELLDKIKAQTSYLRILGSFERW